MRPVSTLKGRRILLAEDEFIIAAMAHDMLLLLGATVIGPAATVDEALSLAATESIDAAVLDVNMRGKLIDPVAEMLIARSIPMVIATGYGPGAVACAKEAPVIDKPYTLEKLSAVLLRALNASA